MLLGVLRGLETQRPLEEFSGVSPKAHPLTQGLGMLLLSSPPPEHMQALSGTWGPQLPGSCPEVTQVHRLTAFGKHEEGPAVLHLAMPSLAPALHGLCGASLPLFMIPWPPPSMVANVCLP
ncbi:hypothetical protein ACRRTK_007127 [Alexandromys fortis]